MAAPASADSAGAMDAAWRSTATARSMPMPMPVTRTDATTGKDALRHIGVDAWGIRFDGVFTAGSWATSP